MPQIREATHRLLYELINMRDSLRYKIAALCISLVLALIILEAGIRTAGFVILTARELRNKEKLQQEGSYRILCLGESTTQGQYPGFLEEILNNSNTGIRFSVIDKGIAGTNSGAILAMLDKNIEECKPHMVVVMAGINEMDYLVPWHQGNSGLLSAVANIRVYRLYLLLKRHMFAQKYPNRYSVVKDDSYAGTEEESLIKSLKDGMQNLQSYKSLCALYINQGRNHEAEELLKKALQEYPREQELYGMLGHLYFKTDRKREAERVYMEVIKMTNSDWRAFSTLGKTYLRRNELEEAEKMFIMSLAARPTPYTYTNLADIYKRKGNLKQAEDLLTRGLRSNKYSDAFYGALGILYLEQGDREKAGIFFEKAEAARRSYVSSELLANYPKITHKLLSRKIKMIAMQYPMRNVKPLKMMLDGYSGIIFVNNETVFKNALKNSSYNEYFSDQFAGDFGHCTDKGNKLIAGNLAAVILDNIYH